MKQLYKLLLSFTLLLTMVILVPYTVKAADTEMTIYGIYLESEDKGESVLLESDGHYLLMDIGSSGSVPAIIKQLQNRVCVHTVKGHFQKQEIVRADGFRKR